MPLTPSDRHFVKVVDHLKLYLLLLAASVLIFLMCTPASQIHLATAVVGIALCWLVWLTQRLLSLLAMLDLELNKAIDTIKRVLPTESRHE